MKIDLNDYELTNDHRCETCAFYKETVDFCQHRDIKCLPRENRGVNGNYKRIEK